MWKNFKQRLKRNPPGQSNDQQEVKFSKVDYDSFFNSRMYLTRLAYRIPFFIIEVFVILLFSVLVPVLAGNVLIFGMKIIGNEYAFLLRVLGYWCVGLVTIGGASITLFIIFAIWSALKDAAVRLWKLIRERKKA